jgi:serine/threonine-protein kinase
MTESGSFGSKQDYTFGQVAIRENLCTFEQVKECLDIQARLRTLGIEPKKLGEILVDKGYLTPENVVKIAKLQSQGGAPAAPAHGTASAKFSVPGYEVISKIGQGAMGMVFKARQISMDRIVAIKVLSPRYSKDPAFVERFVREARAVAKLNHENIIGGIDVGESGGHHYFVMEFVDGVPVTSAMKRDGRLDERRTLQIGLQVAKALSHAHRNGIVHRDIKPENVMLTANGVAKLCDLGLAKQTKGDSGVTMDGTSVGTPNYISPEQARGEDHIDIRTDLYSLGASLYHMATGSTPYSGANPMVVMTKHVTEPLEPPKKRHPGLSDGFNALVMRMMQKRREDRYQDPDTLATDIQTLLDGGSIVGGPKASGPSAPATHRAVAGGVRPRPSTVSHAPLVPKRSPLVPVLAAVGAVVVLGIGIFAMSGGPKPEPAPPPPPTSSSTAKSAAAPPPPPDVADRVRREVQAFRELIEPNLVNEAVPDRYTSPYARIVNRIDHYRKIGDLFGEKAWTTELTAYTERVNAMILKNYYEPIRARVKEHFDAGRYAQAQEELAKIDDAYRWFRKEDKPVPTAVGKDAAERGAQIAGALRESYLAGMIQADQAFRDPKRRDEAYGMLDGAVESAGSEGRAAVEERREKYFREDVGDVAKAAAAGAQPEAKVLARIAALKALHPRNPAAQKVLDGLSEEISRQVQQAASAAVSQAMLLYSTSYKPRFEESIKVRDLAAVRKALYDLYFAPGPLATAFLPVSTDLGVLRAYLDPQRTAPGETKKIAALAEEGIKFCAARPSQNEAARELYTDLRIVALLEDLLDQAGEGAKVAGKDPARFKTGYSPLLQSASSVEPAPRKPGDPMGLAVSSGATRKVIPLAPAGRGSLPEDDIVALAKRAPAAATDPLFPLKAFYLYFFAEKLSSAKDWLDRLTTPESRLGTERYADRLKGLTSSREEAEAAKAITEAWDLLHKKKDATGAAKRLREILEKYSNTEFMRSKVPPSMRTRLEIVEDFVGPGEGKPRAVKASLKTVFGFGEVKDLGRGRYEVTYKFSDDREAAMFVPVSGGINVNRTPMGLGIGGNGQWAWNVPLRGAMGIEVGFRPAGDGAFGLVVCGDGDRQGYLAAADLPLPGLPSNDAIIRLPAQGAQILANILASGGPSIQQARGQANTGALTREGTRLRFTLNGQRIDAEHPQYNEGRLTVALLNHSIVIDHIKVHGEPDPAWLEAELKKAEGR